MNRIVILILSYNMYTYTSLFYECIFNCNIFLRKRDVHSNLLFLNYVIHVGKKDCVENICIIPEKYYSSFFHKYNFFFNSIKQCCPSCMFICQCTLCDIKY